MRTARIAAIASVITALISSLTLYFIRQDNALTETRAELRDTKVEVGGLHRDILEYQKQMLVLNDTIQKLTGRIGHLVNENHSQATSLVAVRGQVAVLRQALAQNRAQLQTITVAFHTATARANAADARAAAAVERGDAAVAQITTAVTEANLKAGSEFFSQAEVLETHARADVAVFTSNTSNSERRTKARELHSASDLYKKAAELGYNVEESNRRARQALRDADRLDSDNATGQTL